MILLEEEREVILPYTSFDLQKTPHLFQRKKRLGAIGLESWVEVGHSIHGTISLPLTAHSIPHLFFILCNRPHSQGHEMGTQGLYFKEYSELNSQNFTAKIPNETHLHEYPDLSLIEWTISGTLGKPLTLELDVHGKEFNSWPLQEGDTFELSRTRLYYFEKENLFLNDEMPQGLQSFSWGYETGEEGSQEIRLNLIFSRRNQLSPGYHKIDLSFSNPFHFEKNQNARFQIYLRALFHSQRRYKDTNLYSLQLVVCSIQVRTLLNAEML